MEIQNQETKNNVILGILGAILGSIIGVVIWILIYKLGYISSLGGLAIAFFAFKGYQLLGRKIDKLSALIVLIVTIIMVYVSIHLSYALGIYEVFREDGMTIIQAVKEVWLYVDSIQELSESFVLDLFKGYAFTIIGLFYMFKGLFTSR